MRWALLFLLAASAFGQQTNYRWDWQATTTQGVGQRVPVLAEPGVHISFYLCTAGVCTTPATTYQSAASSTACPPGEPVVWQTNSNGSCTAIADPQGKFGGWFQPGLYGYYIGSAGPYFFTVGGGGGGGGNITGSLTAATTVLATGPQTVGSSTTTDNGTTTAFTESGGITSPKYNAVPLGEIVAGQTVYMGNGITPPSSATQFDTMVGDGALGQDVGTGSNTAFGAGALNINSTGFGNTALGEAAMLNNTSGFLNTAFGDSTLYANTTGQGNTGDGQQSLANNTTGNDNTAVGDVALYDQVIGSHTVGIGYQAGGSNAGNTNLNNSVYIGDYSEAASNNLTNQIVIGYQAVGTASNQITIGSGSVTNSLIYGSPQFGALTGSGTACAQLDTAGNLNRSPGACLTGSVAGSTITPGVVNGVISASGINGAGIGVAQTTWSNSPTYPQCTVVSHSGNYIAVSQNQAVTPGTNAAIWYPVPNANTPTAGDCAFYVAASQVSGTVGSEVLFPPGNSNLNIGLMEPTVTSPGNPVVAVRCAGKSNSTLTQTASISNAMFTQPNSTVNFAFANLDVEGCTFNANFNAPAVMNIYGAQQFKLAHLRLENPADGSDHYIEFGHPSSANHNLAWTYEPELDDIDTLNGHGPGTGAVVTASVSSGVPTFTVSSGGTSYNATYSQLILSGTTGTNVDTPCTSRGTDTIHITSGVITSITTTATGCATPLYAQVFGGNQVTYCFKFNDASDSKLISGLTPSECTIGMYESNVTSQMSDIKTHPIATLIGIEDLGNNLHYSAQMDTVYRYGFDFEGATNIENVYGTDFEYSAAINGVSDYHFGAVSGSPTTAPYQINVFGDVCGNAPSGNNYNHTLQSTGPGMPTFAHMYETTSCSGLSSNTGAVNTPGNFTAAGALQGTSVGATQGTFNAYGGTNLQYEVNGTPALGNSASAAAMQLSGNYITFSNAIGETAATVASATTIAPTSAMIQTTGTTEIDTLTVPGGFTSGGCVDILTESGLTFGASGNIQSSVTTSGNASYRACYFPALGKWTIK